MDSHCFTSCFLMCSVIMVLQIVWKTWPEISQTCNIHLVYPTVSVHLHLGDVRFMHPKLLACIYLKLIFMFQNENSISYPVTFISFSLRLQTLELPSPNSQISNLQTFNLEISYSHFQNLTVSLPTSVYTHREQRLLVVFLDMFLGSYNLYNNGAGESRPSGCSVELNAKEMFDANVNQRLQGHTWTENNICTQLRLYPFQARL